MTDADYLKMLQADIERFADLDRRVAVLEAPQAAPSRGCVCPPRSEQTCGAPLCPRKMIRIG